MVKEQLIMGRNPVGEALKNAHKIEKIMVANGTEGSVKKIVGMAKDQGVQVQFVERKQLDRVSDSSKHQGVVAFIAAYEYWTLEDLIEKAKTKNEPLFFILLDGIEDPHNLGSIIRSGEVFGAHGVIIPKRRAAGITEVAIKASAGAIEYLPVAQVSNLIQAMDQLKKAGVFIGCADMEGQTIEKTDFSGHIGLVIGNEGKGVSRLVKENCDFTVSIPMKGQINSLNASVAAGILLMEISKNR